MRIVVISPHQDDETLGAGGTLLRLKNEGHQIYWLNITAANEEAGWDANFVRHRKYQVGHVMEAFAFDDMLNLNLSPATLENETPRKKILDGINGFFDKILPEWVILPDYNDIHSDHRVVYECGISCSKIFRNSTIKRITTMEILSETDYGKPEGYFAPNLFVDITDYLDRKLEIMQIYDTEIAQPPFPRSLDVIKALALARGATSGVKYAEGFRIIRMME
ncbi:MAG: PIG-L family deacetylase [Roseburia sp.]|nr:PIG-L family deacetylase [Roseburia sp.]